MAKGRGGKGLLGAPARGDRWMKERIFTFWAFCFCHVGRRAMNQSMGGFFSFFFLHEWKVRCVLDKRRKREFKMFYGLVRFPFFFLSLAEYSTCKRQG